MYKRALYWEVYRVLPSLTTYRATIHVCCPRRNFPESIHEDMVDAGGLNWQVETITRVTRNPQFRVRVLTVYGYTYAVWGFDVRLGETALGVEAAHITWDQAGGPNIEINGLALGILHHKLFDREVYTVSLNRQVQVSEYAYGATGFTAWLLAYHGKPIRLLQRPPYLPKEACVPWYMQQIFCGPARQLQERMPQAGEEMHQDGRDMVEVFAAGVKRCRLVRDIFRHTAAHFDDLVMEISGGGTRPAARRRGLPAPTRRLVTVTPLGDCQVLAARISQDRLLRNRLVRKGHARWHCASHSAPPASFRV